MPKKCKNKKQSTPTCVGALKNQIKIQTKIQKQNSIIRGGEHGHPHPTRPWANSHSDRACYCSKMQEQKAKHPDLCRGAQKSNQNSDKNSKTKFNYTRRRTRSSPPPGLGRSRTPTELANAPVRTWNTAASVQLAKKVIITSILHLLWNFIGIAD